MYLVHLFGKLDEIEDDTQFLAISIFLGYVLASVLFEPDFGSHGSVMKRPHSLYCICWCSPPNQRLSQWKRDVKNQRTRRKAREQRYQRMSDARRFFSGDITRSGGTENVSIMLANTLSAGTDYTISFISLFEEHDSPFFPD